MAISHIPVNQSKKFDLHLDKLDDIDLTEPLIGTIHVEIIDRETVVVRAECIYHVRLQCDRCGRSFVHHGELSFTVDFGYDQAAEFAVDNGRIDISEPIRQELLVHLPFKQLCDAECSGISDKQKENAHGSS